ncbi:MAG: hypothetical protein PHN84_14460 [Desulfuromonadaceae bacterium]|nr:hypothetical protein [Desulfuromonadaceae bacterium]MDD2856786.1 hypothetical protein [Desulfuromonadaceae bacterium]
MAETYSFDAVYEEAINSLIDLKSPNLIPNASLSHARSLIRALVSKVAIDEYIGIFTGSLSEDAFGPADTVEAFKTCLSKGIKLKLLFHEKPDHNIVNNAFYKSVILDTRYKNNIEVRYLKPENANENLKHLLTVNDSAFRLETDHNNTKAYAAFNNKDVGTSVREYFSTLFNSTLSEKMGIACLAI